jgi:hypothetical protein
VVDPQPARGPRPAPGADRLGRQHHVRRRDGSLLAAITYGIQPYGGAPTGWSNPVVLGGLAAGVLLLVAFCVIETRVADPMFDLSLSASVPSARATSPRC